MFPSSAPTVPSTPTVPYERVSRIAALDAGASFQVVYRWMMLADGSGCRSRSAPKRPHVSDLPGVRRSSHLCHILTTW
jgi:hypothetical protein